MMAAFAAAERFGLTSVSPLSRRGPPRGGKSGGESTADFQLCARVAIDDRPDWVIPDVRAVNLARRMDYRHGLRTGANLSNDQW